MHLIYNSHTALKITSIDLLLYGLVQHSFIKLNTAYSSFTFSLFIAYLQVYLYLLIYKSNLLLLTLFKKSN